MLSRNGNNCHWIVKLMTVTRTKFLRMQRPDHCLTTPGGSQVTFKKPVSHSGPAGQSVTTPRGGRTRGVRGQSLPKMPRKPMENGLFRGSRRLRRRTLSHPTPGGGVPGPKSVSHFRKSQSVTPRGWGGTRVKQRSGLDSTRLNSTGLDSTRLDSTRLDSPRQGLFRLNATTQYFGLPKMTHI